MYDISVIPEYDGCVGSMTNSKCSHASIPTTGMTVLRKEKEVPCDIQVDRNVNEIELSVLIEFGNHILD